MRKWVVALVLLVPALAAVDVGGGRSAVRSRAREEPAPASAQGAPRLGLPARTPPTRTLAPPPAPRVLARSAAALPEAVRAAMASVAAPAPVLADDRPPPSPESAQAQERAWEAEADDEAWTAAATESLADMMAGAGLAPAVVQGVACRKTLCRIELAFPDFASAMKLGSVVAAHRDGLEVVPMPAVPAQPRYLVYAARPGERIATEPRHGI
jgi:hypothetical protein